MQADLLPYRDHRRLLVLFAPSALDPRLVRQRNGLRDQDKGMRDRQLLTIVVLKDSTFPKGPDALSLRKRYRIAPNAFEALLIGKDGTVASRTKENLSAKTLFARIDAMPMRRAEIRRKGG